MATFYGPKSPNGPSDGDEWVNQTTGERRIWAGNAWSIPNGGGQTLAPDGTAAAPGVSFNADPDTGIYRYGANTLAFASNGAAQWAYGVGAIQVRSLYAFGWSATSDPGGTADVLLVRDAAATLAQRDGTNAQAFRAYRTFTDASNYERVNIGADVSGIGNNTFSVVTQAAGTGSARPLYLGSLGAALVGFVTSGTTRWAIDSNGNLTPQASLATNMTSGFANIPGAAGAPVGTPANTTGFPLYWDSTNLKLYVYTGGAWKASAAFS
jgi:hypothetical protein